MLRSREKRILEFQAQADNAFNPTEINAPGTGIQFNPSSNRVWRRLRHQRRNLCNNCCADAFAAASVPRAAMVNCSTAAAVSPFRSSTAPSS